MIRKSKFDMTHQVKFTCDMGNMVPSLVLEVVPGDRFTMSTRNIVRFSPLLAPLMHNVDVYVHYYYVPNRLLWDNWESFITGGERGDDQSVSPYIESPVGGFVKGSLADYFGIAIGVQGLKINALPFRAYSVILNEWMRQQDLQDERVISKDDGLDSTTPIDVINRNWNRDYFTSSLPYAQKGEAVHIPVGSVDPVSLAGIPVTGIGKFDQIYQKSNLNVYESGGSGTVNYASACEFEQNINEYAVIQEDPDNPGYPNIRARLDQALSSEFGTINDLRTAFQLQRYLEKNARAGSRYVEFIRAHFGVRSPDARLQRPEYLGAKRAPVIFSEVLQTSSTDATSPQANLAGHGFAAVSSRSIYRSFSEHGWIMGLFSVMPRTAYQQGVPRMFSRTDRYEYLNPMFVHLGEQAVLNKEVYADGTPVDDEVFGYQARYEEYRRCPNRVAGDFRDTLDYWHMGRKFASRPLLNNSFLQADPTTRIFAVTDPTENKLQVQLENKVYAIRTLPKRGIPGYIDH